MRKLSLIVLTSVLLGATLVSAQTENAQVTGSVAYRERMALPPDAVIDVQLIDTSIADVAAQTVAEVLINAEGRQVPVPFTLTYDPAKIDSSHRYSVRATIRSGDGMLMFSSTQAYPVLTHGAPSKVNLILHTVGHGAHPTTSTKKQPEPEGTAAASQTPPPATTEAAPPGPPTSPASESAPSAATPSTQEAEKPAAQAETKPEQPENATPPPSTPPEPSAAVTAPPAQTATAPPSQESPSASTPATTETAPPTPPSTEQPTPASEPPTATAPETPPAQAEPKPAEPPPAQSEPTTPADSKNEPTAPAPEVQGTQPDAALPEAPSATKRAELEAAAPEPEEPEGESTSRPERPAPNKALTPLADTQWKLVQLNGQNVVITPPQKPVTLAFSPEGRRIAGSAGCNSYLGTFTDDHGHLELHPGNMTMMMCADPAGTRERKFVTMLRSADGYKISGGVLLLTSNGKTVAKFQNNQ